MTIVLNGTGLTIEDVAMVAREFVRVEISADKESAIIAARSFVEEKANSGKTVYGLTTGFGKFSDTLISPDETQALQRNLIVSHACAVGNPLDSEIVRAMMLLRVNALVRGNSGIRLSTIKLLVDMLNNKIHPIIPEKGSLGASGDLAPLAHMALAMMGEGQCEFEGRVVKSSEALNACGLTAAVLEAKEGLALINGTQCMTAIGALAVYDAVNLMKVADIGAAMTCEAQKGIKSAFWPHIHRLRPHQGQNDSAANILKILEGSGFAKDTQPNKVQDAYSVRCAPQVHGASRDAIRYTYDVISTEINSVTDNPILFPDEDVVISGGNFHGQPVALAMDFLGIAMSELANIAERRIERMVNPMLSGLPAFLTNHGGLHSGFMIVQYSAASMVSENKVFAHPASVDSIPSSGNQEDHVSMGTTGARKARLILNNSERVLALEIFCAAQALSLAGEEGMSPATRSVYDYVRKYIPFIDTDEIMYPHMEKAFSMVKNREITAACESVSGALK